MPSDRDNEFKKWFLDYFEDTAENRKTASDYIQKLILLGWALNVTLDKEYKKDKLVESIKLCKEVQPEVSHHQDSWLTALAEYKRFCDECPPK